MPSVLFFTSITVTCWLYHFSSSSMCGSTTVSPAYSPSSRESLMRTAPKPPMVNLPFYILTFPSPPLAAASVCVGLLSFRPVVVVFLSRCCLHSYAILIANACIENQGHPLSIGWSAAFFQTLLFNTFPVEKL